MTPQAVIVALAATAVVAQPFAGHPFQRRQDKPARPVLKRSTVPGVPRVTVLDLESQPGGVAALRDAVWVAENGALVPIDAAAMQPALVRIWLADRNPNRIKKVR